MCSKHISPKLFYNTKYFAENFDVFIRPHVCNARIRFKLCISINTEKHRNIETRPVHSDLHIRNRIWQRFIFSVKTLSLEFIFHCEFSFLLARVSATTTRTSSNRQTTGAMRVHNSCSFLHNKVTYFCYLLYATHYQKSVCLFFNYNNVWCVADLFFAFFLQKQLLNMNKKVSCTSSTK